MKPNGNALKHLLLRRQQVHVASMTARFLHVPLLPGFFDAGTFVHSSARLRNLTFYPGTTGAPTSGIAALHRLHARFPVVHVEPKSDLQNVNR